MKFLILLLITNIAYADSFQISVLNNFNQFKSKDKVNKGEMEFYSILNPKINIEYGLNLNKKSKFLFQIDIKNVNFNSTSFENPNIVLYSFLIGQRFVFDDVKINYSLGMSEKMTIFSKNSKFLAEKIYLDEIGFGIEKKINSFGFKNCYINFESRFSGLINKNKSGVEFNSGNDMSVGLSYRLKIDSLIITPTAGIGIETLDSSITYDRFIKSYFGVKVLSFW